MANTDTENILDKARNAIVASGSFLGISIPPMEGFSKGNIEFLIIEIFS